MLFYSDFDIKRFIQSKHILCNGTFSYPKGFNQTIIIMYYAPIILKMIPGIFGIINNKTYFGYKTLFEDLSVKLGNLTKNLKTDLKIETLTTDFEIALYKAFLDIFNKEAIILRHIGCYFHYMYNINKNLGKYGFYTNEKREDYEKLVKYCSHLPFKKNVNINIENLIYDEKISGNKKYDQFLQYFNSPVV